MSACKASRSEGPTRVCGTARRQLAAACIAFLGLLLTTTSDAYPCNGLASLNWLDEFPAKTLVSQDARAMFKGVAYLELLDEGKRSFPYYPLLFRRLQVQHQYPTSYVELWDDNCGFLQLHIVELPGLGVYSIEYLILFLRQNDATLSHVCTSDSIKVEFPSDRRFHHPGPLVANCSQTLPNYGWSRVVLKDLEIELDGDKHWLAQGLFSKPRHDEPSAVDQDDEAYEAGRD